jgi:hypothetical protein
MHKYVVSTYYYQSERSYAFIMPENQVDAFIKRINAEPNKYSEPTVQIVNDPSLFGTGRELSDA